MTRDDLLIDGQWQPGRGGAVRALNPASGEIVWAGRAADRQQVDDAVAAAQGALPAWSARSVEERCQPLRRMADLLQQQADALALTISRETGKPRWESATEVKAMVGKVELSIDAYRQRRPSEPAKVKGSTGGGSASGTTIYKPHGVAAVFGPFNLPGHLPHGHIVPALIAGNTVVFKPSERTPGVAVHYAALWQEAGLPPGVINLVQGGREVGEALASHQAIDGLFFTGGTRAGLALAAALAQQPQKILALEMGGNNPLVVDRVRDVDAAAYLTVVSAYITAGQRCTCARRLIVPRGSENDAFVDRLVQRIGSVTVGPATQEPEPFMGPLIAVDAADAMLATQADWERRGGRVLVEMNRVGSAMVTPGLMDVTAIEDMPDEEHFGPLLALRRVDDFDAAIKQANATRYGLSAGLLSDDGRQWETFLTRIRAGVVTWNRQTTGASGQLPFGGIGLSGNHRPSGYWAADYCSYPVAVMQSPTMTIGKPLPGLAW